jgi:hypothetical protein
LCDDYKYKVLGDETNDNRNWHCLLVYGALERKLAGGTEELKLRLLTSDPVRNFGIGSKRLIGLYLIGQRIIRYRSEP